ncbi:transketolase family protein [Candidatus Micrarchaeota archaeon]|nr:transketolase family protein [Candidatus Micrarchaeota archaeon]
MHLNREGKPTALRDGFGKAIVELAEKQNDVWALTADVAESSRVHWFAEKFPERFVQVGVAEQNLAGVGAGIASCGKVAFISAFGAFNPGRNWDQIRVSVCYNDVPVIVHASHTGITVGPDGASHQVLEDIALTRSLPNMSIFVPCDAEEARKAVFAAYSKRKPAYIRTGREKMPIITTAETPFEIGKANVLRDGSEVVIFACGIEVYHSLQAAEMLEKEGVSVAVVNVHTIKPFDSETVQRYASKCMLAVSVEEHQINGGLGSAVAEAIAEKGGCRLVRHGIQDSFAESGEAPELMKKYKLDADGIYELIKNEL